MDVRGIVLKKIIYFDNAATTQMDERVLEAMLPFLNEAYGNANARYSIGYEAGKAVSDARKKVAFSIGAEPDEIYFTSGGTECNNTVLNGISEYYSHDVPGSCQSRYKPMIISTEIEHDSVLKRLKKETEKGTGVLLLKPDTEGRVNRKELEKALHDCNKSGLVSVMLVNNEIGTIQPIRELADIAHENGFQFHTDAVQAAGHMKIDVKNLGVDALSVSGHKLYGPKGVGFLYLKRGTKLTPLIMGGGQEKGVRSGTLNVPGIVGLGKACELASSECEANSYKEKKIADYLRSRLLNNIPDSRVNGDGKWILNFSFDGINGTSLALRLDMEGICVSTGSACSAGLDERSHVLTAIGLDERQADSSIRISIGKYNTLDDARLLADSVERLTAELRSLTV